MSPASMARYRWSIASRVLAAIAGGYTVAALASAALALALPRMSAASRADAVMIATLSSFAIYTAVALWVFCARSATQAWLGLGGTALGCGLLVVILRGAG